MPGGRAVPRDGAAPGGVRGALRRLAEAGKVAIVLKVGTSEMGAKAALAHTGALVGSDRSFSAMLRHYNAIRWTTSATGWSTWRCSRARGRRAAAASAR